MEYLVDTGILLRVANRADALHGSARGSLRRLRQQGHALGAAAQNMAEFWSVCTRPATARGGLGLSITETKRRLRIVERIAPIIPDAPAAYDVWKRIVARYSVSAVQVHDARLVALMIVHQIEHILTFNVSDFSRYEGIVAVHPDAVVGVTPT